MTTVAANTPAEWRSWLAQHSQSENEVWLILYHANSGRPSVRYHEAVEQALCYGWIDGVHRKRDAQSSQLRFTPRNPRSTWSRINRERAERMIELGLMTEHGQAVIDLAKASGRWQVVPDGEGSLPDDLQELLQHNEAARANFQRFPPSSQRLILEWIASARRPDTRRRRIEQTVNLAAENIRANHPG